VNILGGGFGGGSTKNLIFRFTADTARASRAIDNLILKIRKAQGMGGPATSKDPAIRAGFRGIFGRMEYGILDRITQKFGLMGEAGEAALSGIAMKASIAGAAIMVLGFALNKVFHYGNLVEGALIQMELLTGSAKKAQYEMKEAMRYSLITPYRPAEVLGATATSLQYGIDPFKKGAYGLGKNRNAMEIFGGLGSFRDLRGNMLGVERMTTAVLRGDYRLLRPVRGIVGGAYDKAKATGFKVGTQGFNEKFIEELGKVPAIMNAAKKNSESMAGLWSTISGFGQEFWVAISGAGEEAGVLTFWSQIRSILKDIRDAGIEFMDYIRVGLVEFGANVGAGFKFIWDTLKEVWRLVSPFLIPAFKVMWQISRAIGSTFVFLLQTVVRIFRFVADLVSVWGNFFDKIFGTTSILSNVVSAFTEFVTGLQIMFQFASIFIDWVLDAIIKGVEEITSTLSSGLDKAGGSLTNFYNKAKNKEIDIIKKYTGVDVGDKEPEEEKAGSGTGKGQGGRSAGSYRGQTPSIVNIFNGAINIPQLEASKMNQTGNPNKDVNW
jgi:hypothetical protein